MSDLSRYLRQVRFPGLGEEGQRKLLASRVLLAGCGALGSMIASTLTRAGVGFLRLVDRDVVEWSNLHRQVLYDETDARAGIPKAIAAANHLRQINSEITLEPVVADLEASNIAALVRDVDLILDGTDNFETRFLLNDAALKWEKPWVLGGCLGAEGQTMTIVPGVTPCLRCLMPEMPAAGTTPTCETAGILAPIAHLIASLQTIEAIKILSGNLAAINPKLTVLDLWGNRVRQLEVATLKSRSTCPACQGKQYAWLEGTRGSYGKVLCGRNAVHLACESPFPVSLEALAIRLEELGSVARSPYLLRFRVDDYQITIFSDGRAIIQGTEDIPTARKLYARYVGT